MKRARCEDDQCTSNAKRAMLQTFECINGSLNDSLQQDSSSFMFYNKHYDRDVMSDLSYASNVRKEDLWTVSL